MKNTYANSQTTPAFNKTASAKRKIASAFREAASAYKSGGVSLYIVVFLTLILGIITLGFTRIVLNDATETSNTDLYNSAYDSALAGIEDAKIALIKYHDCLSQGAVANQAAATNTCPRIVYEIEHGIAEQSCDVVQAALGRDREQQQEVIIQETQSITDEGSAKDLEQAYTCVKITEETESYLTTLTARDDNRIIPLRSANINEVSAIEFSWYSSANGDDNYMGSSLKKNNTETAYAPPIVTLDLFWTDTNSDGYCAGVEAESPCFIIGELSENNSDSSGTDHAMLVFRPVSSGGTKLVTKSDVLDHSDKHDNAPIDVTCSADGSFYCSVVIELPDAFRHTPRATATSFLRATLPYERPSTDLSVSLCKGIANGACTDRTQFTGVQAAIDSTGRANDLYRRLETRIELVDLFYPYPEYALYLSGDGNSAEKHYYVTNTCWQVDNGVGASGCKNSKNI